MIEKINNGSNFFSKKVTNLVLLSFLCLVLLSLVSSVSAVTYTNVTGTNMAIQNFINTSGTDSEIILNSGNYSGLSNLNVSRSVTIRGNGQVNINSTTGGTLFNINAANVKIINLTISGYATAISSNASGTSISNCNITTTGNSITFTGRDSRNILLERNIIRSGGSGVILSVPSSSVVGISFLNNNITGTGTYGVYLSAYNSNNTITFTNNNITVTGTYGPYGVYLDAYNSNNTITFTNNNITGTSGTSGVGLSAYNSNNTITFTNNKITGTSGTYGVYLSASNSNNTITFTNNKITGRHGVGLSASNSNNTITFTNNNITVTGTYEGVYLYADSANKTINQKLQQHHRNRNIWCLSVCIQQQ